MNSHMNDGTDSEDEIEALLGVPASSSIPNGLSTSTSQATVVATPPAPKPVSATKKAPLASSSSVGRVKSEAKPAGSYTPRKRKNAAAFDLPPRKSARDKKRCVVCVRTGSLKEEGGREFGLTQCDYRDDNGDCGKYYCQRHLTGDGSNTETSYFDIRVVPFIACCPEHRPKGTQWQQCKATCPPEAVDEYPFAEIIIDKDGPGVDREKIADELVYDMEDSLAHSRHMDDAREHVVLRRAQDLAGGSPIRRFHVLGSKEIALATDRFLSYDRTNPKPDTCGKCRKRQDEDYVAEQLLLACQADGCAESLCARCAKISYNPLGWLCYNHRRRDHPRSMSDKWLHQQRSEDYIVQRIRNWALWSDLEAETKTGIVLCKDIRELDAKKERGLFDCELLAFPAEHYAEDNKSRKRTPTALVTREKLEEVCPEKLAAFIAFKIQEEKEERARGRLPTI